jgi:hypothetical protein
MSIAFARTTAPLRRSYVQEFRSPERFERTLAHTAPR